MANIIEDALFSIDVYSSVVPQGWTQIAHSYNDDDSFYAAAYSDGSEIVIAYRGSTDLLDYTSAVGASAGFTTAQMNDALGFYSYVEGMFPGSSVSFTGHSLGGALAAFVATYVGSQAVTFDATGSVLATQNFMWSVLTPEEQASTDESTFFATVAAYMQSSAIEADHVNGEVAYNTFASQVAGAPNIGLLLPDLTNSTSVYSGVWAGAYSALLPSGSLNWAANLHNMSLALLAEVDGSELNAAIAANPFFIRQLMNEDDVSQTGLHVSGLLSGLAAQDLASEGSASVLANLIEDSNVIAGAHIDPNPILGQSGPNYSGEIGPDGPEGPLAELQTGLTSLAVGYAALSLSSAVDTGLFHLSNLHGANTTVLSFQPPQIASQAVGEVDAWINHQIDGMHFDAAPTETIASQSWVSIVAPGADAFYAATAAATGPALVIGNDHGGTFVTGASDTTIFAPGGSITVNSGDGNLTLWLAGAGHSEVYGGAGDDIVYMHDAQGSLSWDGGGGFNTLSFEHAPAGVVFDDNDDGNFSLNNVGYVVGSSHDDTILSLDGIGTVSAGPGNDQIVEAASGGWLAGLYGGDGNDTITLHQVDGAGTYNGAVVSGDAGSNVYDFVEDGPAANLDEYNVLFSWSGQDQIEINDGRVTSIEWQYAGAQTDVDNGQGSNAEIEAYGVTNTGDAVGVVGYYYTDSSLDPSLPFIQIPSSDGGQWDISFELLGPSNGSPDQSFDPSDPGLVNYELSQNVHFSITMGADSWSDLGIDSTLWDDINSDSVVAEAVLSGPLAFYGLSYDAL